MSDRAKIRARRVTGNSAQQQKLVADAIKLAREMALVPYVNRVTTQRQKKDRDGYRRADRPAPRPSGPPPKQGDGGRKGEGGPKGGGARRGDSGRRGGGARPDRSRGPSKAPSSGGSADSARASRHAGAS